MARESTRKINWISGNRSGYAGENYEGLNGIRVRPKGELLDGVIFNVRLDRENRVALVSVNFEDEGLTYLRCFFVKDLELVDSLPDNLMKGLLNG